MSIVSDERIEQAVQHVRALLDAAPWLCEGEGLMPGALSVTWQDLAVLEQAASRLLILEPDE